MNCQIVQIKSDILELKIISSRIDNSFKLASLVEIDRTSYLEYQNLSLDKNQSKLFGEIIQISFEILKLKLFRPSLFTIGKIVKLNALKVENLFLPQVLNRTIVFGETFELDSEQIFEFIPTALVEEQVVEGQKIGYILKHRRPGAELQRPRIHSMEACEYRGRRTLPRSSERC